MVARKIRRLAHHDQELLGGEFRGVQREAVLQVAAHDPRELDEEGIHLQGVARAGAVDESVEGLA